MEDRCNGSINSLINKLNVILLRQIVTYKNDLTAQRKQIIRFTISVYYKTIT